MLIGKYDPFLTSHISYMTLLTPTYPYEKKYDSSAKIDDMRGVLIRRTVVHSVVNMTVL